MINLDDGLSGLLAAVADAVGLQEGEVGVERVLRAIGQLEPASTRAVSRHVGLPLPLVAAVNNELRARDVLTRDRPSRLTAYGRRLLDDLDVDPVEVGGCTCCAGHSVVVPAELTPVVDRLARLIEAGPEIDLTLDQSFATAATKVRRVLLMMRYGLLPGRSVLLVGDDDLMSVTIAAVGAALGRRLVHHLAVVDISPTLLDFIQNQLGELGQPAELRQHDLRRPLPERFHGAFELAMTDPPYTTDGAALFLSRAVEGLRPGPGRSVIFSFGPKGPDDTLEVQRTVAQLGLTVQAMHRNFNEYLGAGVIGGVSHLQHLVSTAETAPMLAGDYTGPLYTADQRTAPRQYACNGCGSRYLVGQHEQWTTIALLKQAGCAQCGGDRFRPLQLVKGR
ncbi:bis-aminopropyl spermidine synthase family protein [Micromonospora sp. CPCC 206060]|uniref:bis-aminopropyl spermidine synthase family protein n=1 Tax=Micromonospora sp. CPCC 206060 TaxID=3122406 RepID=UPI002FEFAED7